VRLSVAGDLSDNESSQSHTLDSSDNEDEQMENGADVVEDYDPDMDDEEATRLIAERIRAAGDQENHPAENGIIEEVVCTNFMCHAHLSITIGPLINFIIGHNGSGKSAVLTALTLCLGGKATATNRGQSLKSFIKTGKESATLSVKIKNQGPSAYKRDIYGNSIIVQRHFNRQGTSGFKIQNANGKIISTKKSELEDILDVFALQLDNPMNVLTQDMARQFLNNSTPLDKYRFFYKGTHLEQLDADYRILSESVDSNDHMEVNLKEATRASKRAFDVAEKKSKMAENQKNLQETYKMYSRQMAWAQVAEQEQLLEDLSKDIDDQNNAVRDREQEAEESGAQLEAAEEAKERAEAEVRQLEQGLVPQKDAKEQVAEQFKTKKKELLDLHAEQRSINAALLASRNAIKNTTNDIHKEEEKLRAADNGLHAQKMENIKDAQEKLQELQGEQRAHSSQSSQLDKAVFDAEKAIQEREYPVQEKVQAVQNSERRLKDLAGDRGNWMRAYPPNLDKLLKAIQNETRFKEKPVGPLGRHVALLKPEWSSILEVTFGGALNGFAVSSKRDQDILTELMRRTG
jgi:chromosome segregation ATPase